MARVTRLRNSLYVRSLKAPVRIFEIFKAAAPFSSVAALELGQHGITVNAYAPGPIDTTFRMWSPYIRTGILILTAYNNNSWSF